jgi:hypothetical protein
MRDFFAWYRSAIRIDEPWLMLGKGPSFSRLPDFDTSAYRTLALNHVVAQLPVTVAHAIDIEVVEHCKDTLSANAQVLVMPWVPHCRKEIGRLSKKAFFGVGEHDLEEYCAMIPVLHRLDKDGRLLWYNLYSAPPERRRSGSPIVRATDFSASAALNLLALAGTSRVRSLGVDGGTSYSNAFQHLENKTKLQTGQASYNSQFKGIATTLMTTGVDFAPLDVESPIKVFVGTQPEQMLAFKVLEHSIRRHCSMSIDVIPLFEAVEAARINIPNPSNPDLRPRTPFSFQRFAIPSLKGYCGRAIYLDSDMQVFKDIKELWMWPLDGSDLLTVQEPVSTSRRPQFSVMVLDCERLSWDVGKLIGDLEAGRWTYEQFMYEMAPANRVASVLPSGWNDLERHTPRTALTHYTDMDSQPWLTTQNLLGELWCKELFLAVQAGFIHSDFLQEQVDRGWVRPSLIYQLKHDIVDPLMLPRGISQHDASNFVPPHLLNTRGKTGIARGVTRDTFRQMALSSYARIRHLARTVESRARQAKRFIWSASAKL